MATYPTYPRSAFVEWCASHAGVFQSQEAGIGLSKAQAAAFGGATEKAETLLIEQAQAWERYLVASQRARDGVALLRREAGDCVRSIRAFAEVSGEANKIYGTARIPVPKSPTPARPPARPSRLAASLNATTGELRMTWKASDPNRRGGVVYLVRRRLPGEDAFSLLGTTGKKTFVDSTLPAGTASVQYSIQPQRGGNVGARSEILTVHFGAAQSRDDDAAKRQNLETSKGQKTDAVVGRGRRLKAETLKTESAWPTAYY